MQVKMKIFPTYMIKTSLPRPMPRWDLNPY